MDCLTDISMSVNIIERMNAFQNYLYCTKVLQTSFYNDNQQL